MFDSLFINLPTISFFDVLINIILAFIFGFFVSVIYRLTYKGYSYSSSFVNALVILSMVTAVVIMVIGNNLARAFGLVGAMSIIRFRTVVKDTRDIVFVFFALAGGMAAGAGNHMVGIVGSFVTGIVLLFLFIFDYASTQRRELLLRFCMVIQSGDESIYLETFNRYLSHYTLLNVKSVRMGQFLEHSFHVRLKDQKNYHKFLNDLSGLEGLERISLVFAAGEEESR